jgi:hypothetical protein
MHDFIDIGGLGQWSLGEEWKRAIDLIPYFDAVGLIMNFCTNRPGKLVSMELKNYSSWRSLGMLKLERKIADGQESCSGKFLKRECAL